MNGILTDNIDNYEDWEDMTAFADHLPCVWTGGEDEMTEEDWDRYSHEFEARYNEHLNSIKSSSPRRVGRSTASRYYDEGDGLGNLLPTIEEIEHYRRALGCDEEYNLRSAIYGMTRPHEGTMAEFFLESQW